MKHTSMASMGGTAMNQLLAGMILNTTGVSGKERIQQRRRTHGIAGKTTSLERWGKPPWASEKYFSFFNLKLYIKLYDRSSVSSEDEYRIEGCLSGEAALIILDTLEALMRDAKELDDMQATLPKAMEVLLHLLARNESVAVMGHIFATQRAVLVKVTQEKLAFAFFKIFYLVQIILFVITSNYSVVSRLAA